MKTISIDVGDHRLNITVREAEDPATWELQWSGYLEPRYAHRMLKAAETIVLQNGRDRMTLVCAQTRMRCAQTSNGAQPHWLPEKANATRCNW